VPPPPRHVGLQPRPRTVAACATYGCSRRHARLQPPPTHGCSLLSRTVAASATHGCSLRHARLQPPPPTVAASATYGCSLRHVRLQVLREEHTGDGGRPAPEEAAADAAAGAIVSSTLWRCTLRMHRYRPYIFIYISTICIDHTYIPIRTKLASGCRPENIDLGRSCYSHPAYIYRPSSVTVSTSRSIGNDLSKYSPRRLGSSASGSGSVLGRLGATPKPHCL